MGSSSKERGARLDSLDPRSAPLDPSLNLSRITSINSSAGRRDCSANLAASLIVGYVEAMGSTRPTPMSFARSLPTRSRSCASYRLIGRMKSLRAANVPSPEKPPHTPTAQLLAVGGRSQRIVAAWHCHNTQLAADQPVPG